MSDYGITWSPAALPAGERIGLIAINNATAIPGIVTLTIRHTSNSQGYRWAAAPNLITVSFPNLVTVPSPFIITGNPLLSTLTAPSLVPTNGKIIDWSGNALLAASVNALLARGVANAGFTTGTIRLNGGTNAAPSGQGIADKATLIGRGVTVNTN